MNAKRKLVRYKVHVGNTQYYAYSSPHQEYVAHVVTLLLVQKTGTWADGEEILLDAGHRVFLGKSEQDCLDKLQDWVEEQFDERPRLEIWKKD